jgi:putative flavoprotein involved in K+ transport
VERVDVAVVGGGQAGLATSAELSRRGIEHVVLERGRVGQSWRDRWDSFCLVTPNWMVQLPDGAYAGDDPDGYLPREGIVDHFERYAERILAPVREGVDVSTIDRVDDGFVLTTLEGPVRARRVVLATGAYQRPYRPEATSFPSDFPTLDVGGYRHPGQLPDGGVLVVGSGQSGCQLAEELHQAGRDVVLACGRANWVTRRIGAYDVAWWGLETGFLSQPRAALADPSERLAANLLASGHDGGHDLHLRTLQAMGVELAGHFRGASGGSVRFEQNLADTIAWGDEAHARFMQLVRATAEREGIDLPPEPEPGPFDTTSAAELPLSRFGSVIFTGGFRPDYRSWLPWPDAFDDMGFPVQEDGVSSVVPGVYFIGVHFMRTRKSTLLVGVGEDAAIVAAAVAEGVGSARG